MAIAWSSWDYSGNNGMRLGIDASASSVSNGSSSCTITWRVYTENQYLYQDNNQEINYSGNKGGQKVYNNTQGGGSVTLRDTFTTVHNYSGSSYGSSPGKHTVTARIGYTYNGSHPSRTVSVTIPARPVAGPSAPSSVKATRSLSNNNITVSWNRTASAGRPVTYQSVQRRYLEGTGDSSWVTVFNLGTDYTSSGSNSWTYTGASANSRIEFRVRTSNSAATTGWVSSNDQYTDPAAPGSVRAALQGNGTIRVTWRVYRAYDNGTSHVERQVNGGAWSVVATGIQESNPTWTDGSPGAGDNRYRVRDGLAISNPSAELWSGYGYSNTVSAIVPPLAPSNLSPNGVWIDAFRNATTLRWQHNPGGDGADQSGFEIRYSSDGGTSWTWIPGGGDYSHSGEQSYTLAPGTLANGATYQWQVRTWGADSSPGPYSSSATLKAAAIPVVDVTGPAGSVIAMPVTATWSYSQEQSQPQTRWHAKLFDGPDNTYNELGAWVVTSGATSHLIDYPFEDGKTYSVWVRTMAVSDSLWSEWDFTVFTVDLLPPADVSMVPVFDPESGVMVLTMHADEGSPDGQVVGTNWSADPRLTTGDETEIVERIGFSDGTKNGFAGYGQTSASLVSVVGAELRIAGNGTTSTSGSFRGGGGWGGPGVTEGETIWVTASIRDVSGQSPTDAMGRFWFGEFMLVQTVPWVPDANGVMWATFSDVVPAGYSGPVGLVFGAVYASVIGAADVIGIHDVVVTRGGPLTPPAEWPVGVAGGGLIIGDPGNPAVAADPGTPWTAYLADNTTVTGTIDGTPPTWPSTGTIEKLMVGAGTYFDGDTTDTAEYTYDWTGAVGASTSEKLSAPTAAVATVDVHRRIDGGNWVTIHAGLSPTGGDLTVLDTAPTIKGSNEYRLVVTSISPSTAITDPVEVVTDGWESTRWAFLSYGPGFTIVLRGQGNPKLSESTGRASATHPVLGRPDPLLLIGGQKSRERSISLRLLSDDIAGTDGPSSSGGDFEVAGRDAGVVLWRDWTGARIFGRLSGVGVDHLRDHDATVSFSVEQIAYDENVGG